MGFLDFSKPKRYDMDTLEGIMAIPVPARNYNTGNDLNDKIYYVLQRKATEHKKAGRMDCAIACLRKSNELSDFEERPLLMEKDYLRLPKYIELTGNKELAAQERENIYRKHPEFLDKRISNLKRIRKELSKYKRLNADYVFIETNSTCPICSQYNRQTFSINKRKKKYPPLPKEFSEKGGFCPNCIVGISAFYDGINTLPQ